MIERSDNSQGLQRDIFSDAVAFRENLNNSTKEPMTYNDYCEQYIEVDAREYAKAMVEKYRDYL